MATVYLAYDRKHRRDVALKVLLPGLAAFLGVERFLKEIQVAARLTHPHILALHDSGEAGGFLYYVMPYIEGGSLRQHLAGKRPPGDDQALAIAAPAPPSEPERGRRLFVAKGCVTCHVHREVAGSGVVAVGPELTNHPLPTDYLKQFLANPGVGPQNGTARMPDLGLESQEIATLVAFLSAERLPTVRPAARSAPPRE